MTTSSPVALIPRSILLGNPEKAGPQISPDGTRLAYLAPVQNVLNVWVGFPGGNDFQPITKDEDRGILSYFWAPDNQQILYLQDSGGNENWRLYATHLETGQTRDLTPFAHVQTQILHHDKHFPNELLLTMNKEDPRLRDVYHLDLPSGTLKRVAKNPGNVARWVVDRQFQVRGAVATHPDGRSELLIRDNEHSDWRSIVSWKADDVSLTSRLPSGPVGFTLDGQSLFLLEARDANASRLVRLHITTGDRTVLASDPQYDVSHVLLHPDTYEVQAVAFNKDRLEWTVLDESIKRDFERLRDIHRGDLLISGHDDANQTWMIRFTVDNGPVPFYAYDRKQQSATLLFEHQPAWSTYTLARMEPISFSSRDGLTIHGYLTLPPGEAQTSLPMVLNVHGGPWFRDSWGYHPEAQLFANRGYACLQINFRGSTGYGKDFLHAGDKEWGRKMHHDLVDGVNWAIEQGIADPQRIAIYGGSYGGYAALVGATFTPDLFCCAVDIVGPSNLLTFIQSLPPYWSMGQSVIFRTRVGNPDTEEELLQSRSPLFKVDQIKIPLLIAQGANDPRVKQAESEQIVAAMKRKGIPYEYLLFPDEGHGFVKPENRLTFYAAVEKFLARYLGGRYEE